ncbi:unnamed protein product [Haemonchus placei]|uniref:Kinesin motor domain-containing protein n=1 Tax=Haemonchus placei TaxID=6290 RepID=A0A0N4W5W1_HAEPC|nr:unnamed protein product [Haemonchus placei]
MVTDCICTVFRFRNVTMLSFPQRAIAEITCKTDGNHTMGMVVCEQQSSPFRVKEQNQLQLYDSLTHRRDYKTRMVLGRSINPSEALESYSGFERSTDQQ